MNHESFLAAIESGSEDRVSRLVYADWLDERGDMRAALIRTEEEMRTIPIYADRYWELKRQRDELRPRCDPEWLRRMRYGTAYEPVFRHVPDDWRGRWRLLREFVERWYGIPSGDVGRRRKQNRRIEQRLGCVVSPAIHEWIAFHAEIKRSWDRVFRDVYHVRHYLDLEAVSLLLQWEGDYHYAVCEDNLNADDPQVDGYGLPSGEGAGYRFVHRGKHTDRLTDFVFGHINFRLTQGVSDGCLRVELGAQREALDLLNAAFPSESRFGTIRFFETTNLLAWVDERSLLVKAPRALSREEFPTCFREHIPEGSSVREMVVCWPRETGRPFRGGVHR